MTIAEMLADLDDSGFADVSAARKVSALNSAYHDICRREAWPFLEKEIISTVTPGNDQLTLPTDWSKTLTLTLYDENMQNGNQLQWVRQDDIQRAVPNDYTARPRWFYFIGNNIYLFPDSDRTYNAQHVYIAGSQKLDASTSEGSILLPAAHHELIVVGALSRLHRMMGDRDEANACRRDFEQGIANMRSDAWTRGFESDTILDVDPDWYSIDTQYYIP